MGVHADEGTYKQVKALLGIPEDEGIFVLREQDRLYCPILHAYEMLYMEGAKVRHQVAGEKPVLSAREVVFADQVYDAAMRGKNFQRSNPDRVKFPD